MEEFIKSVRKNPLSPTKSCSPAKLPFLTKDSRLTNFVGWDVDGRLNEFESHFKVMKEAFDVSLADKRTLEEVIELAKNRGRFHDQRCSPLEANKSVKRTILNGSSSG
jgi:kinesin family protein C1